MKTRMNRMVAGGLLGLFILTGSIVTARAAATKTPFTLAEVHVAWLVQSPPEITPSGNVKIRGWQHLWFDDADDDRVGGYTPVVFNLNLNQDGEIVAAWGTFTVREKLDDLTVEDFASPDFNVDDVIQGEILWQGNAHLGKDGVNYAVGHNDKGMTAFWALVATANPNFSEGSGYILDPHGD